MNNMQCGNPACECHNRLPRVLALDVSADSTGVALPDGSTFVIKAPKPAGKKRTLRDDLARMMHAADKIDEILIYQQVDLCVIEDYAFAIKSTAAHRLAEIGGIYRLAVERAGVPITLVNVMHLKMYAGGSGKADKSALATSALKRAGREFPTTDECDAWWLRAALLDRIGQPVVEMPESNRLALDRITWSFEQEEGASQ